MLTFKRAIGTLDVFRKMSDQYSENDRAQVSTILPDKGLGSYERASSFRVGRGLTRKDAVGSGEDRNLSQFKIFNTSSLTLYVSLGACCLGGGLALSVQVSKGGRGAKAGRNLVCF